MGQSTVTLQVTWRDCGHVAKSGIICLWSIWMCKASNTASETISAYPTAGRCPAVRMILKFNLRISRQHGEPHVSVQLLRRCRDCSQCQQAACQISDAKAGSASLTSLQVLKYLQFHTIWSRPAPEAAQQLPSKCVAAAMPPQQGGTGSRSRSRRCSRTAETSPAGGCSEVRLLGGSLQARAGCVGRVGSSASCVR